MHQVRKHLCIIRVIQHHVARLADGVGLLPRRRERACPFPSASRSQAQKSSNRACGHTRSNISLRPQQPEGRWCERACCLFARGYATQHVSEALSLARCASLVFILPSHCTAVSSGTSTSTIALTCSRSEMEMLLVSGRATPSSVSFLIGLRERDARRDPERFLQPGDEKQVLSRCPIELSTYYDC